jgi:hypothetical protein
MKMRYLLEAFSFKNVYVNSTASWPPSALVLQHVKQDKKPSPGKYFEDLRRKKAPKSSPFTMLVRFFITSSVHGIYEGFYAEGPKNTFLERVIKKCSMLPTEQRVRTLWPLVFTAYRAI